MIGIWHEAARRLRERKRSAAVIGAALLITAFLCILCGYTVQNTLTEQALLKGTAFGTAPALWDAFLLCSMLTAAAALTPLRIQCAWELGRYSGLLDANDLGFLECCGRFWLWSRAFAVRMLSGVLLLLSALPPLLLYAAAKSLWLLTPAESDSTLQLLTVLHLGIPAAAGIWLPLRVLAAMTALPYSFLKQPHAPAYKVIRLAFRLSRGQTAQILLMRLLALPLLLFPFTAVSALPVLLTTEQLRCERAWRHLQPKGRSVYSHLELHAYEPG